MTKEDLENEWLYGYSLELALECTKIAPPRPSTGKVKNPIIKKPANIATFDISIKVTSITKLDSCVSSILTSLLL